MIDFLVCVSPARQSFLDLLRWKMFCRKSLVVRCAAVAAAFVPRSRLLTASVRPSSVTLDQDVDARRLTTLEQLKKTLVCHMSEINQRHGDYHILMQAEHLHEIGLFLESEYPSLMCEGRPWKERDN